MKCIQATKAKCNARLQPSRIKHAAVDQLVDERNVAEEAVVEEDAEEDAEAEAGSKTHICQIYTIKPVFTSTSTLDALEKTRLKHRW